MEFGGVKLVAVCRQTLSALTSYDAAGEGSGMGSGEVVNRGRALLAVEYAEMI